MNNGLVISSHEYEGESCTEYSITYFFTRFLFYRVGMTRFSDSWKNPEKSRELYEKIYYAQPKRTCVFLS